MFICWGKCSKIHENENFTIECTDEKQIVDTVYEVLGGGGIFAAIFTIELIEHISCSYLSVI